LRERKRNSAPIPKEKEFRDQKGKQRKIISTPNLQMKRKFSPLAKEKEVGRKYYLLTIFFPQKV
jgi:hypothetical protein